MAFRRSSTTATPRRRAAAVPLRRGPRPSQALETVEYRVVDAPAAEDSWQRHQGASRPDDHAQYRCACGFVFEAAVSTTVGCPHCGEHQAW